MIESDGGDQRRIGIEQIDSVKAPAETDFENCHIDTLARKDVECCKRAKLEICQRDTAATGIDTLECFRDGLVTRLVAVDTYAFVVTHKVR